MRLMAQLRNLFQGQGTARVGESSSGRRTSASLLIANSSRFSSRVALTRRPFSRKVRTALRCPSARSGLGSGSNQKCRQERYRLRRRRSVDRAGAAAGKAVASRRGFLKRPKECHDEELTSVLLQTGEGVLALRTAGCARSATGVSGRSTIRKEQNEVSDMSSHGAYQSFVCHVCHALSNTRGRDNRCSQGIRI